MKLKLNTQIVTVAIIGLIVTAVDAQTFTATRIDGRPAGHALDSGGFDPIIDINTFIAVGATSEGSNINGPSLVRLPDWLATEDRVDPSANYYLYFANHNGDSIRTAWAASLTGDWNLFNYGTAPDRAWGVGGSNTGAQTLGNGVLDLDIGNSNRINFAGPGGFAVNNHIASPDVFIDDVNQRFVMYFHGPNAGAGTGGQQTFVTTSSNGLNFNTLADGGQAGHGPRDVIPAHFYTRAFTVSGQTFAYSNMGELWQAPAANNNGNPNTLANADSEGGLWNPVGLVNSGNYHWTQISQADNPIDSLYVDNGQGADDVRHFAIYQRDHIDPTDTNVYVFYSARFDTPESIFLSVIDTDGGSTDPGDWTALGQRVMLQPELNWEGGDLPLSQSQNGSQTNVRQLRDPGIFEDTMGTADPSDDKVYLLYSGEGEEAIGFAELTFDAFTSNFAGPQGDLGLTPPPTPSSNVFIDFDALNGPTQQDYTSAVANAANENTLGTASVVLIDPFIDADGDVTVTLEANRWKQRNPINSTNPADELENLLIDFGGPETGTIATLTLDLPTGEYVIELVQHESSRSSAETASLSILDADGLMTDIDLISSFGTDPVEVVITSYTVTSNGIDDVIFIIDNTDGVTTGAYPINGLTVSLIPEPGSLVLLGLGGLCVFMRRRRSRCSPG